MRSYLRDGHYERELIKMAKTMDMEAIVKKTGRSPKFIMKVASRLGIKVKGRKAVGRTAL